jgi:hypothetical protein
MGNRDEAIKMKREQVNMVYREHRSRSQKKYKCGYLKDLLAEAVFGVECHQETFMKDGTERTGEEATVLEAYIKALYQRHVGDVR